MIGNNMLLAVSIGYLLGALTIQIAEIIGKLKNLSKELNNGNEKEKETNIDCKS